MNAFPPEGTAFHPRLLSPALLRSAARSGAILQAPAVLCDEWHDLYVDLGGRLGRIARQEAACGIAGGAVRDIALLTRVGKLVCFCVRGFSEDGEPLLSRRAAQLRARERLFSLPPGTILPAVVTACTPFGAFCDVGCGVEALLGLGRVCAARIRHTNELFTEGQRIYAAIAGLDPLRGRVILTHQELLGTWRENAALFRAGQTVTGIVRGVMDYGVFVELTPNLTGLADSFTGIACGDAVSVYIKSIQPERGKIRLSILRRLRTGPERAAPRYFLTRGSILGWRYR